MAQQTAESLLAQIESELERMFAPPTEGKKKKRPTVAGIVHHGLSRGLSAPQAFALARQFTTPGARRKAAAATPQAAPAAEPELEQDLFDVAARTPLTMTEVRGKLAPQGNATEGVEILAGTVAQLPHTYVDQHGRPCKTGLWVSKAMLVFFPAYSPDQKYGRRHPMLALEGPGWRVYYPEFDSADYASILNSGSSGRWMHSNGLRKGGGHPGIAF